MYVLSGGEFLFVGFLGVFREFLGRYWRREEGILGRGLVEFNYKSKKVVGLFEGFGGVLLVEVEGFCEGKVGYKFGW